MALVCLRGRHRLWRRLLAFVCLATSLYQSASAATDVSGVIASSVTWTSAGSPYRVVGDIDVPPGVTVTMQDGVVVEFVGAHRIKIGGAIVASGGMNRIKLRSTTSGVSSGATMLLFEGANLSLTTLAGIDLLDAAYGLVLSGTTPCTGTLNVSASNLNRADVAASGAGGAKLVLDECALIGSRVIQSAGGERVEILRAAISEATVRAGSAQGMQVVRASTNNARFELGCCGATMDLSDCTLVATVFEESDSTDAALSLANCTLIGSRINLPHARITWTDSSARVMQIGDPTTALLRFGTGTVNGLSLEGAGGGIGLEFAGTHAAGTVRVERSRITGFATAVRLTGAETVSYDLSGFNVLSGTTYAIENLTAFDVAAADNYWGTTGPTEIAAKLYDKNDNSTKGTVVVSGALPSDPQAPVVQTQPTNLSIAVGGSGTLYAFVGGSPLPTYQWLKDGTALPGATSNSLAFADAQIEHAGKYRLVATNALGTSSSVEVIVTVVTPTGHPSVTQHPASLTAVAGGTVQFTVVAGGAAPLAYQWRKNLSAIVGATSDTLTLQNIQLSDAAEYSVVVTNAVGSIGSIPAVLTVTAATVAPSILTQPTAQTVVVGGSANFSVTVSGSPSPTLQWFKDGVAVPGATAATLALTNVQFSDAGAYHVRATNVAGIATSNTASLTVQAAPSSPPPEPTAPVFTLHPVGQNATNGVDVQLVAEATGSAPISYTWKKDGQVIAGATGSLLLLRNVAVSDAGLYRAVATNGHGTTESNGAIVTVTKTERASRFINLSTRGYVGAGNDLMIAGFFAGGSERRSILIRAVGPTLEQYQVSGVLARPTIELVRGQDVIQSNTVWKNTPDPDGLREVMVRVGAFALPENSLDSAMYASVPPGPYTALVRGVDAGTGIALVEVYEGSDQNFGLTNLSSRGWVGTNDRVLIAGVVITGEAPARVLVRVIGPTLGTHFGIDGALAEPQFAVYEDDRLSAQGSGRVDTVELVEASQRAGAFALPAQTKDAAVLLNLSPGRVTIVVSGVNATTGVAVVELYHLR